VGRGSASTENHAALLTNHEEGLRADEVGNRADSEGIQLKRILRRLEASHNVAREEVQKDYSLRALLPGHKMDTAAAMLSFPREALWKLPPSLKLRPTTRHRAISVGVYNGEI